MSLLTPERVRATTGSALLITRRRARQDAGLLLGAAALLLATLLLTLAVPRLVERTADVAVREAVVAAGLDADLVGVTGPDPTGVVENPPDQLRRAADWLAGTFGDDIGAPSMSLTSGMTTVRSPVGRFGADLVHVATWGETTPPVRWVTGRPPAPVPEDQQVGPDSEIPVVEVGLSTDAAATLGVTLADGPLTLRRIVRSDEDHLVVTGLYEPVDPDAHLWADHPGLLATAPSPPSSGVEHHVSLYVPTEAVPDMLLVTGRVTVTGIVRAPLVVERMDLARAHAVARHVEVESMRSGRVRSGLPDLVAALDENLAATRAQASLVLAGVATTAALCLVLAASLLTDRRRTHLAAERARGASVASVATRALLESAPVALLAVGAAGGTVAWWLHDHQGSWLLTVAVALVAGLAPVVLAVRTAAAAWAGRRVPADRRERAVRAARGQARRLVTEVTVVVLAVAALSALRVRGLVPLGAGEVDPLLSATPALLAGAAALVVVHVSPAVVRAAGRWAARSRGLAAPLAAARAQGATTGVVPLLTVTVGVALVVLSGTLVHTVHVGQAAAADELVGAPVRLDGRVGTPEALGGLEALRDAPGVTAVATATQVPKRSVGERTGLTATLLVVDTADLADVRRSMGLPVDDGLATLGEAGASGTVPALVSADLLARLERGDAPTDEVPLSVLNASVLLDVRGTTSLIADRGTPALDARVADAPTDDDGLIVVDRALLDRVADQAPTVDRAWVAGPGAVAAVEGSPLGASPVVEVTTRDGWWEAWSSAPLTSALTTAFLAAVGVLAVLTVLALVLVVVATARERGRTLSALRTLGLDARTARWATLGELAPLVVGGLVGGVAIGLALPWLLGDALGLQRLTAQPTGTDVAVTWWPVAAAVAALLVATGVAVVVEQAVRRRDRLGEVLRVGER